MPLSQDIKSAITNLTTLEILTLVGKVEIELNDAHKTILKKIDPNSDPKVLLTKIDLLQGDITNIIDPSLLGEADKGLRDFHSAAKAEGMQIIKDNIGALKELYDLAKSWGN